MITLNLENPKPMFRRPEILLHPTIPERLMGVNPRTIKGTEWWDIKRKAAYTENNGCCWACGRHMSDDRFNQWLEAHESYTYGDDCIAVLNEIVALCSTCHMFIHAGGMHITHLSGGLSTDDCRYILMHGWDVLQSAELPPTYALYVMARRFLDPEVYDKIRDISWSYATPPANWNLTNFSRCHSQWKLQIGDKLYWRNPVTGSVVMEGTDE